MQGLLYGPSDVVHFPIHYGEAVHTDVMKRYVAMVIDGGRAPKVFLELFPKLDYPAFLCDVFPILGGHQEVLDGVASFKMDLDPQFITNSLKAFA